ncbi:uncharacterized protein LOC134767150 [Penaeus indicus]|uniref:uncharacterized protein LOC134767150 n=1 Tax=Penaeus indicus TaxID=29960 RepID=UPI00300D7E2C
MERPLVRRRHAREDYDFGWAPLRASQLASPQVSSSPSRHEDRERRRRRRRNSGDRDRDSSGRRDGRSKGGRDDRRALPTDYRGALAKFAPPAPHALLKKIGSKDVQGLGKVSVPSRRQGGPRAVLLARRSSRPWLSGTGMFPARVVSLNPWLKSLKPEGTGVEVGCETKDHRHSSAIAKAQIKRWMPSQYS